MVIKLNYFGEILRIVVSSLKCILHLPLWPMLRDLFQQDCTGSFYLTAVFLPCFIEKKRPISFSFRSVLTDFVGFPRHAIGDSCNKVHRERRPACCLDRNVEYDAFAQW